MLRAEAFPGTSLLPLLLLSTTIVPSFSFSLKTTFTEVFFCLKHESSHFYCEEELPRPHKCLWDRMYFFFGFVIVQDIFSCHFTLLVTVIHLSPVYPLESLDNCFLSSSFSVCKFSGTFLPFFLSPTLGPLPLSLRAIYGSGDRAQCHPSAR